MTPDPDIIRQIQVGQMLQGDRSSLRDHDVPMDCEVSILHGTYWGALPCVGDFPIMTIKEDIFP